ncbi:hypothetical protein PWY87_31585 [Kribbella solani]|uniref:TPR repeat region-containing protein n=1 Tax=Kribbella solani TaxID=236067 RepID=UPI0029B611E6|nr:hypothetical protein [Kribbella solani]MDX3006261.1 hypothetical protein [Kribbella solani]
MADKAEGGRSGAGDGFCGINPTVLGEVIKDLTALEAAIGAELPRLKAEFDKVGVSTSSITNLGATARWLHEQLPMLRRRQAAAAMLASQGLSFTPNTSLLCVPEDPTAASKQAADLAVQHTRAGLNSKPGSRDGMLAALDSLRQIHGKKGVLGPDDLQFLETYFRGLGKDLYRLPGYLKDDNNWSAPTRTSYALGETVPSALDPSIREKLAEAVGGSLLALTDERKGSGWNRLPDFVRKAASDPLRVRIMPDNSTIQGSGYDATELAEFLVAAGASDRAGDIFSKRLAITVTQSVDAYRLLSKHTPNPSDIDDETSLTFLRLASRNEQAMHGLITGDKMQQQPAGISPHIFDGYKNNQEFLTKLTVNFWSDQGKAAGQTLDWIADAKQSAGQARRQFATDAWNALVKILTKSDVIAAELDFGKSSVLGQQSTIGPFPALGIVNPEITRSLARDAATFLTELGTTTNRDTVSMRLFMLISTDSRSADALAAAIYLHNIAGIHAVLGDSRRAEPNGDTAGRLQGLLDAALRNVAFEMTHDKQQAAADADALRGKILNLIADIATRGYTDGTGKELPSFPSLNPVEIAEALLGRLSSRDVDAALLHEATTDGINPADYTSGRALVRYNFTRALIESGKLRIEDLPLTLQSSDHPPRLKSPAEFQNQLHSTLSGYYDKVIDQIPGASKELNAYIGEYQVAAAGTSSRQVAGTTELFKSLMFGPAKDDGNAEGDGN